MMSCLSPNAVQIQGCRNRRIETPTNATNQTMEPMLGRFMNAGSLNSEGGIVMIFGGTARTHGLSDLFDIRAPLALPASAAASKPRGGRSGEAGSRRQNKAHAQIISSAALTAPTAKQMAKNASLIMPSIVAGRPVSVRIILAKKSPIRHQ